MNRRRFLGVAVVPALGTLAGCGQVRPSDGVVTQSIEESFDPAGVEAVRVVNDIGDVTVRARDVEEIDARILKRSTNGQAGLEDIDVSTEVSGGRLTVRTAIDQGAAWFSRSAPTTDVTVTVPEGEDGPEIDEITSQLGDITLLDTRGDTSVRTNLGDIVVRRVDGHPALRSELGDIVASGSAGMGDVFTELGELDIEVRAVREDIEIATELGDILVTFASDLAVDVVAVSDGDIGSTLDLTDGQRREGRLSGQLNGGGAEVRVTTELGDIALRPGQ